MRHIILIIIAFIAFVPGFYQARAKAAEQVKSPDGRLKTDPLMADDLIWAV